MTTTTINHAAKVALTATLAALASSATWVAGRESSEIDNTTNKFVDALLQGKITVGTTPVSGTSIKVFVWGSDTSAVATNLDTIAGADGARTITSVGVRNGVLIEIANLEVDSATSNRTYWMTPKSIASFFGGVMPKFWGVFVAHNTGVALHATGGNHELTYTGIKYDNA